MSSRSIYSQAGCRTLKLTSLFCALLALGLVPGIALAQGLETPPVTSFRPDTTLPKVQVPEFVITGKAEVELPRAYKPSIEIDSSFFQNKDLTGTVLNVPADLSLSRQQLASGNGFPDLFVKASIGHYTTANYIVSGAAETKEGWVLNGSINGGYSNGFIPYTMQRDFSVRAGVSKDLKFAQSEVSSNSIGFGYSRSSYYLYGQIIPASPYLRKTDNVSLGISSNMDLGDVPLAIGLNFDRSSISDYWNAVESSIGLDGSTQIPLPSGWIVGNASLYFGNHNINQESPSPVPLLYGLVTGLNRSMYHFKVGADYTNASVARDFTYSLGVNYFQYRDESANGIAKIYPDVRVDYKLNGNVAFFASYEGTIRQPTLVSLMSIDRYVDASSALLSTQDYAVITLGSRVGISNTVSLTPQFSASLSRDYPMFVSVPDNSSYLVYADRATLLSFAVRANYIAENFNADATLQFQRGTTSTLSSIPNLSPVNFEMNLGYEFVPHLTLHVQMLLLSQRYADLTLTDKVSSAGLLDAGLSYDVKIGTLPIEFFVDGKNLFNQRYFIWQGYQEFPLSLFVGFSSRIL